LTSVKFRNAKSSSGLNLIELKGALILPTIDRQTGLLCVVVRKREKRYGATGKIAGAEISKDDHVLFFDDVISEGSSKLEAIKLLEGSEAKVETGLVGSYPETFSTSTSRV
jgi:orotate phosphoribosyltransferase